MLPRRTRDMITRFRYSVLAFRRNSSPRSFSLSALVCFFVDTLVLFFVCDGVLHKSRKLPTGCLSTSERLQKCTGAAMYEARGYMHEYRFSVKTAHENTVDVFKLLFGLPKSWLSSGVSLGM